MRVTARRVAAALVAVVGAVVAVTGQSIVATGAPAPTWGTYAQIATKDLATQTDRDAAAQRFNTIVLRGAVADSLIAGLRARRPAIVLFDYEKSAGLSSNDVAVVRSQHPEWIAKDKDGNEIHPVNINDVTLADLTNPAFRDWQSRRIADELTSGLDGVFLDTLGAYFPANFYSGRPIVNSKPVTNAAWRDGSVDLIRRVKALTGKFVLANGFGLGSGQAYYNAQSDADKLIAAADGVQIEGFTRWGDAQLGQPRKAGPWSQDISFLESLGARGKRAYAYTKVNAGGSDAALVAARDYALGTFLVGFAAGKASFGFDDGTAIPSVASDPQWARSLGAPTGSRASVGNATWTRAFEHGTLTVRWATAPAVG